MAEVAGFISNAGFWQTVRVKGKTAEGAHGAKRRFLGLRRICVGLSSARMEC